MGRLVYNSTPQSFDIEDRTLAHLRIVFMNKLRRGEPFFFHVATADGNGLRSIWVHPAVPLVFQFVGGRPPTINMDWVDALMTSANSSYGLTVTPEPAERGAGSRVLQNG